MRKVISVISYQLSVISYQLLVISYQLLVISYQLSVISYQYRPLKPLARENSLTEYFFIPLTGEAKGPHFLVNEDDLYSINT
ncbi:MAG: hypothetical protein F6K17_15715 [Okeania sp. SIO3C4]|nr:hypothetical protein [Okeania sp. SIO3C4]